MYVRESLTSTSWSGVYAQHNAVQGRKFDSHLAHWNFLRVARMIDLEVIGSNHAIAKDHFFDFFIFAYVHAWPEAP